MLAGTQISLEDVNDEYKAFVDKFKPKKTTDDCYTPDNIFEAVKNWAVNEYHLEGREIVRPFWPGGDYERHPYPEGCVVIDNPPFSILAQIVRTYENNGIDFFLFAPYLTNFGSGQRCSHIITATQITYENGANVPTAFVTNLDEYCLRAVPELNRIIKAENDKKRSFRSMHTLTRFAQLRCSGTWQTMTRRSRSGSRIADSLGNLPHRRRPARRSSGGGTS